MTAFDPARFSAAVEALTLDDLRAAAARIAPDVVRTPLLPAFVDGADVRLKPECLQPYGSFKVRAALNAIHALPMGSGPVATASAGNFGQGLAFAARRGGRALSVHVPDNAAAAKLAALRSLGAEVHVHRFEDWWRIMDTRDAGAPGALFVHPVCEPAVIAGNATIGLEIAEDWSDVDAVLVPVGGGGLIVGIALAFARLGRTVEIIGCEVETAAPLSAALAAGEPIAIERRPSFVDGIGSVRLLDAMWPLIRRFVDRAIIVSEDECRRAIRTLAARNHIVAEGAGAVTQAAAMRPEFRGRRVAALVSGGNIDHAVLCDLLRTA